MLYIMHKIDAYGVEHGAFCREATPPLLNLIAEKRNL